MPLSQSKRWREPFSHILQQITAREDRDRFPTFKPAAIGRDVKEAIAFGDGREIA